VPLLNSAPTCYIHWHPPLGFETLPHTSRPLAQRGRRRRSRVAHGQGGRRGKSRAGRTLSGRRRANRFGDQVRRWQTRSKWSEWFQRTRTHAEMEKTLAIRAYSGRRIAIHLIVSHILRFIATGSVYHRCVRRPVPVARPSWLICSPTRRRQKYAIVVSLSRLAACRRLLHSVPSDIRSSRNFFLHSRQTT
jgi:hypothetical protein